MLPPVLSIRNGRRSVVITGTPEQLSRFELYCSKITEKEEAERKNKTARRRRLQPGVPRHPGRGRLPHPAAGRRRRAGRQTGRRRPASTPSWPADLRESIFVEARSTGSPRSSGLHEAGRQVDHRPRARATPSTRLTAPVIRGLGVGIVPAATRAGQRSLFTVGAAPEVAPAVVELRAVRRCTLPDGSVKLSTKFTRLTGRSPILLAGMTPTTVDAKIVAAAANAGHWAELAGGGQVTEPIFDDRVAELTQLLEPGRAVQFNSLFLDPYLWKLQVGGKRLVQKARQSGAPDRRRRGQRRHPRTRGGRRRSSRNSTTIGITHVVFKPGTVEQIKSVIKIAAEVPDKRRHRPHRGRPRRWPPLVGGPRRPAARHLRATCASCPTSPICVGGGIGTPERAAEYLSGRWAAGYGFPLMPVDGILVGTAAMATLEATTSPAVKQLLVETTRHRPLGRRRKGAGRHGIRAQPARRRHPRDRQRRVALRPPARRGRRRRRRRRRAPRRDHRRDGRHRQAVLRRRRAT